jgi:hypothetical protein
MRSAARPSQRSGTPRPSSRRASRRARAAAGRSSGSSAGPRRPRGSGFWLEARLAPRAALLAGPGHRSRPPSQAGGQASQANARGYWARPREGSDEDPHPADRAVARRAEIGAHPRAAGSPRGIRCAGAGRRAPPHARPPERGAGEAASLVCAPPPIQGAVPSAVELWEVAAPGQRS